jgi:hypothetical protein
VADRCAILANMVLAISNALAIDIGLIGVFFVLFPAIVTGLLIFAGTGAYVEKQDNDVYLEEHRIPGSEL